MDLISEKWLPVTLSSGKKTKISLSELIDDTVIDVAWPRADFQGAAWQMLIGVMQCAVPPEDESDWKRVWKKGFADGLWEKGLRAISIALRFGPQKPSFLQSFDPLDSDSSSISGLLIDAPGGNTLKLNKDHFVKRGSVEGICPHCAVMALYTVQTNSPAGGAGYRVGMRGGGPMTTLIVPENEGSVPLWKKLWLNVTCDSLPEPSKYPLIFPWLAPTIIDEVITPEKAHPLHVYWGMPRRIELDFGSARAGYCDLCGEYSDNLLTQMRNKKHGMKYETWLHPLSPYRKVKKSASEPWLALKGQPGGLGYKEWLSLLLEREDNYSRTQPAKVVLNANYYRDCYLWCFAFDMDKAKARCWYQHRVPLIATKDSEHFNALVSMAIELASSALACLKKSLKSALPDSSSEVKVDFSLIEIAFWRDTEHYFLNLIRVLVSDPLLQKQKVRAACRQWNRVLHHYIVNIFDRRNLNSIEGNEKVLIRQLAARQQLDSDYRKLKARRDWLLRAEEEKEMQHGKQ
ncbi:type I-E CRISPR-associated protein Cse1/CasA [Pluralibacter gergoviae]|uniref:type I-E CRISPR-associated protein Cse1/CasA n=1 Tax=Pluralibacter gergoviae TaxID=61647 RepID=UPI000BFB7B24|nr:type I-E CRISPR-associated protein Cse1/CasA [Pluralibacter gergoviae]ELO7477927.1 type I-E CRISPR-associated protein Cse1/CasA [Pluralibacter gergoviae]ELW9439718.1 type I-E CRISPR-associated protein Cse1/CasA [Pluralibacter gergoviae]MCV7757304.1 type I-E CRISPR-associated protein Cse1/CasA [Pluralibacter gergoviae]PHH46046.1 type I-E CRISPR-associated protein Cse1/CasA [Pluralibacter gergoviae]HDS1236888.1 type I-E CRISPR-associated protein Cse1/CasA [Pluralibacter gergoviae]